MPSDEIPAAEFTPHRIPSNEQTPESVRILARAGDDMATLSIVAGGGQLFYRLELKHVVALMGSGAEAVEKLLSEKIS